MKKAVNLLIFLLTTFCLLQSYNSLAQVKANPQDSLILVQLHDEFQKSGWPEFWDTQTNVSTWNGVSLDANGKVTRIYLSNLRPPDPVDSIPSAIGLLKDLTKLGALGIVMMPIKYVSPRIGDITQLTYLYLDYNDIIALPEEMGNLKNLTYFTITYNELTDLPQGMGGMTKLGKFDCSHNKITALPQSFGQLKSLANINFSANNLETFPGSIVDLESLNEIWAANNKMKGRIPDALWKRDDYTFGAEPLMLDVSGNELSGRVLGENVDEYNVAYLDIRNNYYLLQDIYPDYQNLKLYSAQLMFMPQKKFGTALQTIFSDTEYTDVQVTNYTPLQGAVVKWYYYSQLGNLMNTSGVGSGYPLSVNYQGFFYCKVTHPDLPDMEITSNVVRVIKDNQPPKLLVTDIRFRPGETAYLSLSAIDDFTYTDMLVWSVPTGTQNLSFSSNLIIPKDTDWIGTDTLRVSVTDEHGNTTTDNVLITILPEENSPPVVNIPDIIYTSLFLDEETIGFNAWESRTYFDLYVKDDKDKPNHLVYELVGFDDSMANSSSIINYDMLADGNRYYLETVTFGKNDTTFNLTLKVTDNEGGITEQQITFICKKDNKPPQVAPVPEQFMVKGNNTSFPPLDLKLYVTDDYTDVENLTFLSYEDSNVMDVFIENGVAYLTPKSPNVSRTFTYVYTVYEGTSLSPVSIDVAYTILDNGISVSGKITDNQQQPLKGVVISGLSSSVITNEQGTYSIELPNGWSGTITPQLPGHTFNPSSKTISSLNADFTQDFVGTIQTFTVSGKITNGDDNPLPGVILPGFSNTVTTNANGEYSATENYGWSGTITPQLTGYTFNPSSKTISALNADIIQDFLATNQVNISGKITDGDDNPLSGGTLSGFSNTITTNANGEYSATENYGWSGTITPQLTGYTFNPSSKTISALNADFTQDFVGTIQTFTVSGKITDGDDKPLSGVALSGFSNTITTNATGEYSATENYGWSATITPSLTGYNFNPTLWEVSGITSDLIVNFAASTITGIDDVTKKPICNVYPIPAVNGKFTVQLFVNEATVQIFDMAGKVIVSTTCSKSLGFYLREKGVFTLKVSHKEAIQIQKIIVN